MLCNLNLYPLNCWYSEFTVTCDAVIQTRCVCTLKGKQWFLGVVTSKSGCKCSNFKLPAMMLIWCL